MPIKDVKQERSQSDLHFYRWGKSPGSPGEKRPGEGKDGAESPWTRLGTGSAVRSDWWHGGLREGIQSPKQFLSSCCLPANLPGKRATLGGFQRVTLPELGPGLGDL